MSLQPVVLEDEIPVPDDLVPIVVRAAHEGVPVRVMARVLLRHVEPIRECIRYAIARGDITDMPRDDWPPSKASAAERAPSGRRTLSSGDMSGILSHQFRLTSKEADVLTMLMRRPGPQAKASILNFVYGDCDEAPEPKIIDVFTCKIRKKLKKHGITITTVWGKGYTLENEDRVKINACVEAYVDAQLRAVA